LNHDLSDLCILGRWDYRHELLAPGWLKFLYTDLIVVDDLTLVLLETLAFQED
jgi:hypothetical protein